MTPRKTKNANARKAVIYVRISKDRDEETSTDSQEASCRAWAKMKGVDIVAVHTDRGRSAFKGGKRPGLDAAMFQIEQGVADTLVVYALDRFARSVREAGELTDRIRKVDGALVSCTQDFDTSTSMGKAMLSMLFVLAELGAEEPQKCGKHRKRGES